MKLETKITVETRSPVEFVKHFAIEVEEKGTRIEFESPLFASYLGKLPGNYVAGAGVWDGFTFKVPRNGLPFTDWYLSYSAGLFPSEGDLPNFIWLFEDGFLKTGKLSILLPIPLAPNDLEDYFSQAMDRFRGAYLNKLRMIRLSASMVDLAPPKESEKKDE